MLAQKKFLKRLLTGLVMTTAFVSVTPVMAETVRSLKVAGNKRIETETVLSYIPLRSGASYDQSIIDQALKDLYSTGYFMDVQINSANGNILINVIENAVIHKVVFEGNSKVKDDKLVEEVQLRPREVLSRTKVQSAQQRILEIYRRMGRYAATIEPKIIKLEDNRVDLVFEINEGDVTYVRKINFLGNKHVDSRHLEKALLTKQTRWYRFFASDDTYDPDRFIADQHFLRQYYKDSGYPDFRIISAVAELSPDQKDLFITFTVEEGERYKVGKIDVKSEIKKLPAENLQSLVLLSENDWYCDKLIEQSITTMTEATGSMGYAFANIDHTITKNREQKTIDITFEVKEGPRIYVERIDIGGNDRTRDEVIRREIRMQEGDAYNTTFTKMAEQNLNDLGYFKKVEITAEQGSAPDRANILVKVEEQSTGELGFAIGYSTLDKALGNVRFVERNFMGSGRTISADLTMAMKRQDFDIGISDPYFLGYNLEAGGNIFHIRSTRISAYTTRSSGVRTHATYALAYNLYQTWGYSFQQDSVEDIDKNASAIIKAQRGRFYDSAISHTIVYDRRNSRREPTAGYSIGLTNSFSGVGGNVRYMRNTLTGSVFYTPIEDVTITARLSGGHVARMGKDIRVVDCILLGGDSFRGFQYGGLGPRDKKPSPKDGDPLGGTRFWMGTIEALFPIGLPNEFGIKGAAFTDIGSVWQVARNKKTNTSAVLDSKAPRASVGAGIAWNSPFGPLRLDYAIAVKKANFDRTQRITFGVSTKQ